MQRGFIHYVQDGERKFAEAAWIMGGLSNRPWRLFYRFIAVALFSVRMHLQQASFWDLAAAIFQSASVLAVAARIIWGPLVDELRR
jgi:squalene monooxygenase